MTTTAVAWVRVAVVLATEEVTVAEVSSRPRRL